MDFTTILLITLASICAILLIAFIVLVIFIILTIRDIKALIGAAKDVTKNVREGNYSEIKNNTLLQEKFAILVSNRFGLLAPIVEIIIVHFIIKKFINKNAK